MKNFEIIYEISNIIIEAETHGKALSDISKHLHNFFESDVCSFYLLNRAGDTLTLAGTDGLNQDSVGNVNMNVEEGLTGQVYTTDSFTYVNDATKHPKFKYIPGIGEEPFSTFVGIPLKKRDKKFGVMVLQFVQHKNYSPIMEKLLTTVVSVVSSLIQQFDILELNDDTEAMSSLVDYELKGVSLSEGIVIGKPVHVIYQFVESVQGEFDSDEEIAKMYEAFDQTVLELKSLIKRIERSDENISSEIFHTHLMMLKDGSFKNDIIHHIIKYNKGAAFSTRYVADRFIRKFRSFEDVYLRERAADVEDICQRLLGNLGALHKEVDIKENSIIIADRLTPGETASLDLDKVVGFITEKDGPTSHTAILARSREIPAMSGIVDLLSVTEFADLIIIDGYEGKVIINPSDVIIEEYERKITTLQTEFEQIEDNLYCSSLECGIKLFANVSGKFDAEKAALLNADGIGLVRTEILYLQNYGKFSEEMQVKLYSQMLSKFQDKDVIFRLLDIGADKTISRKTDEENPALGLRGARLLLKDRELLDVQVDALLRVCNSKHVKILVPFITELDEFVSIMRIIEEKAKGANVQRPDIGVMIEIPSSVFILEELAIYADFFSVGTNDLFQYFCAVDRNNTSVSNAYNPSADHFVRLLKMIYESVKKTGKNIEICGEIAAEPVMLKKLIEIGYRHFSINPYSIPKTKKAICSMMQNGNNDFGVC